jgi:hypothetical protein
MKIYDKIKVENQELQQRFIEIVESEHWKYRHKVSFSIKKDVEKYLYYVEVWSITEYNALLLPNNDLRGKKYCLDHIIPISYGYKYNIDPRIIGGLDNIQVISMKENLTKGTNLTKKAKRMLDKIEYSPFERGKKVKKETPTEEWRLSKYPIGSNISIGNDGNKPHRLNCTL